MSPHEKKTSRALRILSSDKSKSASIIAAALPPRVRYQDTTSNNGNRSPSEQHAHTAENGSGSSISAAKDGKNATPASSREYSPTKEEFKDRRIAKLEKDKRTMEEEFEKELTTLSETSKFWQQRHSALDQILLRTDNDLKLTRKEINTVQQDREERDKDINLTISSLMLDRDALREAYNESMGEIKGKDEMIKELQGQIRGLKSFVSSNSKMDEQVSDEVFKERMQMLGNGLQNWVIVYFRRVRIDTEMASERFKDELLHLVPTYESLACTSKIHLIQSLVSTLIVESIFQPYFVGLPEERGQDLRNTQSYLSNFGSIENMNQWRSMTLNIIRKEAHQTLRTETATVVEQVLTQVNSLIGAISDTKPSETRDQSLRSLLNSSVDLSRLLRVQKAIFSVVMPIIEGHQKTIFDADAMFDVGGEEEEALESREIRCVTFPGILKAGDENGERGHLRNIVAKIRLLCAPD